MAVLKFTVLNTTAKIFVKSESLLWQEGIIFIVLLKGDQINVNVHESKRSLLALELQQIPLLSRFPTKTRFVMAEVFVSQHEAYCKNNSNNAS